MDEDLVVEGNASAELAIELVSHYRLRDKPARTLEVLRIFLNEQATDVYADLRAGRPVVIRRGPRVEVAQMARSMQAQGFSLRIRAVEDGAEALPQVGGNSG